MLIFAPISMVLTIVLDKMGVSFGTRMLIIVAMFVLYSVWRSKTENKVGKKAAQLDGLRYITGDAVKIGTGLVVVELWCVISSFAQFLCSLNTYFSI